MQRHLPHVLRRVHVHVVRSVWECAHPTRQRVHQYMLRRHIRRQQLQLPGMPLLLRDMHRWHGQRLRHLRQRGAIQARRHVPWRMSIRLLRQRRVRVHQVRCLMLRMQWWLSERVHGVPHGGALPSQRRLHQRLSGVALRILCLYLRSV